jgi:uncharacterized repeat protein (TIGR03806 family)
VYQGLPESELFFRQARATVILFALLPSFCENERSNTKKVRHPPSEAGFMSRLAIILLPLIAAGTAFLLLAHAKEPDAPFGIERRVPWTTSRVVGSPEPPLPYRTERVFPRLRFDHSLDLAWAPGGNRWFVGEHMGVISSFPADENVERADVLLDIRGKDGKQHPNRQLWSLTFHPKFATNGYLFVCYHDSRPTPARCRIVRFKVEWKQPGRPTCNPDTEHIICEWLAGDDHWGGCLKFGPDGYLYFSVGDGHPYADGNESGQDLSDFQASIHRIDVDRTDKYKAYAVPKDNPFVALPGARPEIWAYGLRNVWKMSFDRQSGDLWAGDVGQDLWESIFRIEKGGNYGWSVVEGTHPFRPERKVGPTPILKPIVEHDHSEFRSITGGFVYRGKRLAELAGTYVYGDYETGKIWGLRWDGKKVSEHRELAQTPLHVVGFGEDADGELLILDYSGLIHRLVSAPPADPNRPPPDFPRLLSQTGLFRSTNDHLPAPGLIPYSVNSPLWSDHAHKERFLAVPGEAKVEYHPTESWKFPEGTVLVKTFALDMEQGNPATRKRLETRLLHLEQDHWRGYTYVWNDAQTDAELLPRGGLDRAYTIRDPAAPGGKREQTWHFPSRAECTLCHTMPMHFVLGLNVPQMNRDHDYGGTVDNQLRTLDHIGLFTKPIPNLAKKTELPKLPDPRDEKVPLDQRARSYLHANCAHCHMVYGGGNALFKLTFTLPLSATGIVGTPPMHGDFGIAGGKLVVPGDPDRSLLLHRMAKLGHGRMPHVASSVVDENAVKLVREWIRQLPADK